MKIASILPYKENYTLRGAGAVSLWISNFIRDSEYKKDTFVIGSTRNKNYLTKNYINIENINSKLNSTTKEYSNKIIDKIKNLNFDILELHNRPIMVKEFFGKLNSKIILLSVAGWGHSDIKIHKQIKNILIRKINKKKSIIKIDSL